MVVICSDQESGNGKVFKFYLNNSSYFEISAARNKRRKDSIPATILKRCIDIYLPFSTNAIKKGFINSYFPKELKKSRNYSRIQNRQTFLKRRTKDLLAYCLMCQRFSKN